MKKQQDEKICQKYFGDPLLNDAIDEKTYFF